MSDHQVNFLDLDQISSSIGNAALRSKKGWSVQLADLSESLREPKTKEATQIDQLPGGYYKNLINKI